VADVIVTAEGRTWEWPDADVECRAVVFGEYVSLKRAYPFLKGSRTAIQAGGNMGAFPWKMAQKFAAVITAEPDPECFRCLDINVKESNVTKLNVAFGEQPGKVSMSYPKARNLGAQFVVPGGEIDAITIDSLGVMDCDLIYLDVEGAELSALKGAVGTIALSKPLIVVEDNGLSSRFGTAKGDVGKWLDFNFGYRQVGTSKRDVIYACE
jgi:FkbM family methyltransferase